MNWTDYAHQQIQKRLHDRQQMEPERGALDLNHCTTVYEVGEPELPPMKVSEADTGNPVSALTARDYQPGRGNPSTSTAYYRMLRRLRDIPFQFTIIPE